MTGRKDSSTNPPLPTPAPVHPLLQLQQTIGNQAVQRLLRSRAIQAKLAISAPGDVYEQEADRVAEHVMRTPETTVQRSCAPCAVGEAPCPKCEAEKKALVRRKTERVSDGSGSVPDGFLHDLGPGQPLAAAARAFFEPRFGRDFSRVRVHMDAQAAASARAVNALAYTVGNDVVFGKREYAPWARDGQKLLAHELAHTIQQSGRPSLQRQPAAAQKPAKFYQSVVDRVATLEADMAAQAKQSHIVIEDSSLDALRALVRLCEAVEQESKDDIPGLVDDFVDKDPGYRGTTISQELTDELAARIFQMGLETVSSKLRRHFAERDNPGGGHDPAAKRRNLSFFERLVQLSLSGAGASTPLDIMGALDLMVRAFAPMRDELAAIDLQLVAMERNDRGLLLPKPWIKSSDYFDALVELISRLFGGIETVLQTFFDLTIAEMEAGTHTANLTILNKLLTGMLKPAVFPPDPKKGIPGLRIKVTRTTMKKAKGAISDWFATGKEAERRRTPVTAFYPEQESAQELELSLEDLLDARMKQVEVLATLYGRPRLIKAEGKRKSELEAEAQGNAAAIAALKGKHLRLHSDDDWREFVSQKYEAMINPKDGSAKRTPTEALDAIVNLVRDYLQAFTVHPRYSNIYDTGADNYLNRQFARAMSGQLVHDCGVYALRIAYILSLIRDKLKLRFRLVVLPQHVALVMDSTNPDLPAYIAQNDRFIRLTGEEWREMRDTFMKSGDVTGKRDETQFIGEMGAATHWIGPLDTPFAVVNVPAATGAATDRAAYWQAYKQAAAKMLFGSAAAKAGLFDQPLETRYTELSERYLEAAHLFNDFWSKAAGIWKGFERKLLGEPPRRKITTADLKLLLAEHRKEYHAAGKPAFDELARIEAEEREISTKLRSSSAMIAPGVRVSHGPRAARLWGYKFQYYSFRLDSLIHEVDHLLQSKVQDMDIADALKKLDQPFGSKP